MIPAAKLDRLLDRFAAIEAEMASGASGEAFVKLSREHASLAPVIETAQAYRTAQIQLAETEAMIADPAGDSDMRGMAEQERADLRAQLERLDRDLKIQLLPKDAADDSSAIVEIRAGTGGDEAALFAADLLEMYQRWCGLQGWKTEVMDRTESDLGGIKDATLEVNGRGAFAKLKFESGVHRVQRVPATENQGRIHTSAATVAVLPEAEDVDIVINDKDLRIDVYRAQGAGGQHVNKTESAVRITHLPTGIAVAQQTEKSQHKNKAHAMKLLKAKLYDMERTRVDSARAADRKTMVGSGDRSERIRTYNFPQGRVTDHRINLTLYNLARIISGDELGEIVDALVAQDQADRLAEFEAADFLSMEVGVNDAVLAAAKRLSAAGIDSARLDARLLWEHAQNSNPPLEGGAKFAQQISGRGHGADQDPSPKNPRDFSTLPQGEGEILARFEEFVLRRLAREPVAAILGAKEFWSLDFDVGPGVLIPRPDTETLIEEAIRLVPDRTARLRIADLGTGSGAILIAALSEFPNARGIGFESSADAFNWAFRNAARLMPERAQIRLADWNDAARESNDAPFDLVFSNPPYIPSADIAALEPEVRDHEPRAALDGGPDGLAAYRALAELLPRLLAPGGHALLEIGAGQGPALEPLFRDLELVRIAPDLSGTARCLVLKAANPLGNRGVIR